MSKEEIEEAFPKLRSGSYRITSPQTSRYNCAAWAAGDDTRWWQPIPDEPFFYWPAGAPRDLAPESYARLFELEGYEGCESADLEDGFEKIAIYTLDGEFSHVARQLETGLWTSKLGEWEDIEHATLSDLEGNYYGYVSHVLRRRQQVL